ncbi:MAG: hypothetical protein B7Z37_23490 [Verrucomicrobia bacterium 12-59-8]|nr:MAG: hypothetical protein B7Z37_23490 [Verrucomicrobia bacterium 12-59-8]
MANYDPGYGQAQGIAQALQTSGPQSYQAGSYNPTNFQQPVNFTPTNFQRTQNFNPTAYSAPDYQSGPAYAQSSYTPTQLDTGSDYTGGQYGAGSQYQGQQSYFDRAGAAGYNPQTASLREYSQEDVDKYMSPYLKNVVDSQVSRANTQFDRDMAVNRLQSSRGGGYGDYGSRVSEAIMRSDYNRNVNDMVASSLQEGFGQATNLMQSWRDADLSAQGLSQADRQFGGQLNQADRQFGVNSDLNNAQFAADYSLRQDQELNARNMADSQFGATFNQDRINQMNAQRENQAQFGADFASREGQFGAQYGADQAARANDFRLNNAQFGAEFAAGQNQFGYQAEADQMARLNELSSAENQFGANLTADQRMQLNEMMMQDNQFGANLGMQDRQYGANFGLNAQDQFYNQQMGVADSMRQEADNRMRYDQTGLDTQYQDFLQSRDWDQNQISWLTSILYGTPGIVTKDYNNVYSNPLAQGLGAAAAMYGLYNQGA